MKGQNIYFAESEAEFKALYYTLWRRDYGKCHNEHW
jgi:hypothetical protein